MTEAAFRPSRYERRRSELETYFDRTAAATWAKLTSDAPVSGVRATVRAGRDAMRATLLSWLPEDLTGRCLLDAGCGTGALAVAAAERGARVVAVDLSASLLATAVERLPDAVADRIRFHAGDMLDPAHGSFDHVVAMDSLIHYSAPDIVGMLARLAPRTRRSMLFTVAPRTPLLAAMHAVGALFPRGDRAPAIEPAAAARLRRLIAADPVLGAWRLGRHQRIARGFYISEAWELVRP